MSPTTSPPMDDPTIVIHNPVAVQQPQPLTNPANTQRRVSKPLQCTLGTIIAEQGLRHRSEKKESHAEEPEDQKRSEFSTGQVSLTTGPKYVNRPESFKLARFESFSQLTSITAASLLPWNVMCLSNLRSCSIGIEIERCAKYKFEVPEAARIPDFDGSICFIEKLTVQVPIEFFYDGNSKDLIFGYLPTAVSKSPYLEQLALQLTRRADIGEYPGNEIRRSYHTLIRNLKSESITALIIDTCDVEAGAVRRCQEDFFESLHPIESLHGFPNLRRIVAPQEAFIRVEGRLWVTSIPPFVDPTMLLPPGIETIEIIDSTSALSYWAVKLLNQWIAVTDIKVSSLKKLNKIVLWCDRWYPTLVPDYRVDEWRPTSKSRFRVPGRGGRESALLGSGIYGEYPGFADHAPKNVDKRVDAELWTGRKLKLSKRMPSGGLRASGSEMERRSRRADEDANVRSRIWSMLKKAGISVELRPEDGRGWRD